MSSGAFQPSKYITDFGNVIPIRVQPETLTLEIDQTINVAPNGDVEDGFPSAKVSGTKRSLGINARTVTVAFTASKDGYKDGSPITLPALQPALFQAASYGKTGTYLGSPIRVVGRSAEVIK